MEKINVWIIGLGNVWSEAASMLLVQKDAYSSKIWKAIELKSVYTRNPNWAKSNKLFGSNPELFVDSIDKIVWDSKLDIVVETMWWIEQSNDLIMSAIRSWKSVVTANKDLISSNWDNLLSEASYNWVWLQFEAAVAWWIPVINTLSSWIVWDNLQSIKWIINGTSNYIISQLESNPSLSFADVLKDAQDLWYAEKDPRNDIEWIDAAYKLSILSAIWFGKLLDLSQIDINWISWLDGIDFQYAQKLWMRIRSLWIISKTESSLLNAFVGPVLLSNDKQLSKISWVTNAIDIVWDCANTFYAWPWAWWKATASAVVSDILNLAKRIEWWKFIWLNSKFEKSQEWMWSPDDIVSRFYCRFTISDQPWVIRDTANIISKYWINIDEVHQHKHADSEKWCLPYVMTLESISQWVLKKAVAEIDKLWFIVKPTLVMKIVD